jgi:hypothetical protein
MSGLASCKTKGTFSTITVLLSSPKDRSKRKLILTNHQFDVIPFYFSGGLFNGCLHCERQKSARQSH